MSEAHRNKDDIEDTCDISIFNRVSDRRKVKENDNNGSNKSDENWEVAYDLNSKKELSKQVDEVSQVLERSIPIKVVLPPTKEENSRCKGRKILSDQRIVKMHIVFQINRIQISCCHIYFYNYSLLQKV